jgi:hypothetical protein
LETSGNGEEALKEEEDALVEDGEEKSLEDDEAEEGPGEDEDEVRETEEGGKKESGGASATPVDVDRPLKCVTGAEDKGGTVNGLMGGDDGGRWWKPDMNVREGGAADAKAGAYVAEE